MNDPSKNPEKRWRKIVAFLVVLVLTFATIALLFVTFSEGGWWIVGTVFWLPPYYILSAALGHPAKASKGGDSPLFIDG